MSNLRNKSKKNRRTITTAVVGLGLALSTAALAYRRGCGKQTVDPSVDSSINSSIPREMGASKRRHSSKNTTKTNHRSESISDTGVQIISSPIELSTDLYWDGVYEEGDQQTGIKCTGVVNCIPIVIVNDNKITYVVHLASLVLSQAIAGDTESRSIIEDILNRTGDIYAFGTQATQFVAEAKKIRCEVAVYPVELPFKAPSYAKDKQGAVYHREYDLHFFLNTTQSCIVAKITKEILVPKGDGTILHPNINAPLCDPHNIKPYEGHTEVPLKRLFSRRSRRKNRRRSKSR